MGNFAPPRLLFALAMAISAQALLRLGWVWPGLLLYGVAALVFLRAVRPARVRFEPHASRWSGSRVAAMLTVAGLLLGMAIFFRMHQLSMRPAGIWLDEAAAATRALEILEGHRPPLFAATPLIPWAPAGDQKADLYYYYMAGILKVFGTDRLGLKMVSVLPAILSVGIAFWLFWRLTDVPTAVVGTFLLAVSHWHVTIGRWGWDEVLMSCLQLLAYALLISGMQEGKRWQFVLGGVSLGLGLYTYPTSYVAVLIALAFVGVKSLGERSFWRIHRANLALFFLSAAVVFAPLGWGYLHQPDTLVGLARFKKINVITHIAQTGDWGMLGKNLERYLLMFNLRGDPTPRHNTPGEPQLDFLTAVFFVLGVVYALRRWGETAHALPLIWLGLGLAVGIATGTLAEEPPNAYRTALVAPVACFLAAKGMVLAGRTWREWVPAAKQWVGWGLVGLVAGLILWQNYHIYFPKRAASEAVWWSEQVDGGIPERIQTLRSASTPVFVDPFYFREELLLNSWFLNYQPPMATADGRKGGIFQLPYRFANLFEAMDDPQAEGRQIVYICRLPYVSFIAALFPEAMWQEERNPFGQALYAVVRVLQADLQGRLAGLDQEGQRTLAEFRFTLAHSYYTRVTAPPRWPENPEVRRFLAEEMVKAAQATLAGYEVLLREELEVLTRAAIHKRLGWLHLSVFHDNSSALSQLKQSLQWDSEQPDVEEAIARLDAAPLAKP